MLCEMFFSVHRHPVFDALAKFQAATPTAALCAYGVFGCLAFFTYHLVADAAFSSVITLSAIVQCLGVSFLCIQVLSSGSAAGISAGALSLDALALVLRLSSTTWLNGYLPVDKSGDHVFQIVDICTLVMIYWLLHRVLVVNRNTYQADDDTFKVGIVAFSCLVLAALLHADEDRRPFFDTLWMAGLFAGVVAVLPQFWLITKSGGRVDALTSHYIIALAVSRVLSGMFMWAARNHMACRPWIGNFNHAVFSILGAHVLHLLLLGDFACHYVRAMFRRCLNVDMDTDIRLPM